MIEKELIEKIWGIDFKSFLESENYSFKKEDSNSHRCVEEHSLIITYKFSKPLYFWPKKGEKGDIIDFVQRYITQSSFEDAISYLSKYLNINNTGNYCNNLCSPNVKKNSNLNSNKGKIKIEYATDMKRTYAYLCKTRKLDFDVVNVFVKNKLIRQDSKNNVIFLYKDIQGEVVGAEKVGTYTDKRFKGVIKNSDERYGFTFANNNDVTRIIIFEAPIDMMSYFEMNKFILNETLLLSIGGTQKSKMIETYIKEYKKIKNIIVAVDNDDAGDFCFQDIKNMYSNMNIIDGRERLKEKNVKDWNELLIKIKEG